MSTSPLHLKPWHLLLAIALALSAAIGLVLGAEVAVQSVSFGYGYGIHLVDAQGLNRMPVWINSTQSPVAYTLYPLAAPDFLRRYAADPYLSAPIDTTGLTPTLTWQESYTTTGGYPTLNAVHLPADAPSGIYAITGVQEGVRAATYLVVSPLALAAKQTADGTTLVWAVSLQGQTPGVGLTVTLYDSQGRSLTQAVTDGQGVARFALPDATPFLAVAQGSGSAADALALVGFDWQWQVDGPYWYSDWGASASNRLVSYLYTDRPIYRPGQTVYYQAFVRDRRQGLYTPLAAGQPVTVTLLDARGNQAGVDYPTVDGDGALQGEFLLGDAPPLGSYTLDLWAAGERWQQSLRVEEYRKPEYSVSVNALPAQLVLGDPMTVSVQADYFFGQPVAGATVTVSVYRQPSYNGWYQWWALPTSWPGQELVESWSGSTDAQGGWSAAFVPQGQEQQDAEYIFEAQVTDARGEAITANARATAHWNALTLHLSTDKWGYESQEPVTVTVSAHNHDGTAVAGQPVQVRVMAYDWQGQQENDALPPQNGVTDQQGEMTALFTGIPQGWYRLQATTTDSRGRQAVSVGYLWVFDPQSQVWWSNGNAEISILPDRESYQPGDTANLLIQSQQTGLALLTLEREGVLSEQIVALTGPVTSVPVAISAAHAPNIYARIHLFRPTQPDDADQAVEGRLLTAQTNLLVPASHKALTVTVQTDAAEYRPGQEAALTLQVSDSQGQPVRARVSLALVDEALFAVQEDLSAPLFDTFYGVQPLGVRTLHNLTHRAWDWLAFEDTPAPQPTTTPTASPAAPGASATGHPPRQRFLDTAYWNPNLVTDAQGRVTVTVNLPDNLTTWRVLVRAITLETQVGEARDSLLVTQEIIARPDLPRFAVLGDRFQVGLVAQNFSGQPVVGSAQLESAALQLLDGGEQSVALPSGGASAHHWTAVAAQVGSATVTSTLSTAAGGDQVVLPLPVKAFAVPERWSGAGLVNPVAQEHFSVPHNALPEKTNLTIYLSPSLALGVLDGLADLIGYPYGCVEQTMSRLLPSVVADQAYRELGLTNPRSAELPEIVATGLQKLYGFQHGDGGWGWFYDDSGGAALTAYVLLGLDAVADAGYAVDAQVLERGFAYLESVLPAVDTADVLAFAHYVKALSGRADVPAMSALAANPDHLDAFSLANLALALHAAQPATAQALVDALILRAEVLGGQAHWPLAEKGQDWRWWQTMPSAEKNTAQALRALALLRPEHPLLPQAVRWLMQQRQGAGWSNTQATAFAVLGLVDVIRSGGELESSYSYSVTLNGGVVAQGVVTPQTAREPLAPLQIAGSALRVGDNELTFTRSPGAGNLYYSVLLAQELFHDAFTPVTSVEQGLRLSRTYRLAEGSPRSDGAYQVGDVVEVQLEVEASEDLSYVLVEDPLPAGFEGILERMTPSMYGDGYFDWACWGCWGYNQKNVRDDRVEFFVTRLWPGRHTFTYRMRALTPGIFSVLPGQAYPMYRTEIWGRSASAQVQVQPEALQVPVALTGDRDRSCRIDDFDLRLAAQAYGSPASDLDVDGNGRVDLGEVAGVAVRVGAACGKDRPLVSTSSTQAAPGHLGLSLQRVEDADGRLRVAIRLDDVALDASSLAAYGLTLTYDPAQLALERITPGPGLGGILPLGEGKAKPAGQIALGGYHLPAGTAPGQILATLAFRPIGVQPSVIQASWPEAVDNQGRRIEANVTGTGQVTLNPHLLYVPSLQKPVGVVEVRE